MKTKIQKKDPGANTPEVFACYPVVNGCSTAAIWYGTAEECSAKGKAYEKANPDAWCIVLNA